MQRIDTTPPTLTLFWRDEYGTGFAVRVRSGHLAEAAADHATGSFVRPERLEVVQDCEGVADCGTPWQQFKDGSRAGAEWQSMDTLDHWEQTVCGVAMSIALTYPTKRGELIEDDELWPKALAEIVDADSWSAGIREVA